MASRIHYHLNARDNDLNQKQKNWLKRLLFAGLFVITIIVTLPYIIQYGILKGLTNAGSKEASIDDVDFNLFSGELSIKNLRSRRLEHPELIASLININVDWLPLFSKRLLITSLSLKDSSINIQQLNPTTLFIAGIEIPLADAEKDDTKTVENIDQRWGVGLGRLHLVNSSIIYQSAEFSEKLLVDDFEITEVFSWQTGQSSNFTFNTQLDDASINGELKISIFAEKPSIDGQLNLKRLSLERFQPLLKNQLTALAGQLSADIKFSMLLGEASFSYQQNGSISIDQLLISDTKLKTTLSSISWLGDIDFDKSADQQVLKLTADIGIREALSINQQTGFTLAEIKKISVDDIVIRNIEDIQIASLQLEGSSVAKNSTDTSLADSKKILIDHIKIMDLSSIDIKRVQIDSLMSQIDIDRQGDILLIKRLQENLPFSKAAQAEDIDTTETEEKPVQIKLGVLSISKNSVIKLSKDSEQGLIKKSINIDEFKLGTMDTSAATKPTPVKLLASIDKFSKISVNGSINPFGEKTNIDILSTLSAVELHEFSPIIREHLGYNIKNGQLNADLNMRIKDNILDGKAELNINQLILEPADEGKMAKMTQQLSMPLDSALSLLRDDNDDIKLGIPVKGDIDSPSFNTSDVINTALGNAMHGTVINVLKYALQPYGLIFMATEKVYGAATAIKLDSLIFSAGDASLSTDAINYLERIGELMQKRPNLRIRVCGVSTMQDRTTLQLTTITKKTSDANTPTQALQGAETALLTLANNRTDTVKSLLISTYNINATRLFTCAPKVELSDDAKIPSPPRVDFFI